MFGGVGIIPWGLRLLSDITDANIDVPFVFWDFLSFGSSWQLM